MFQGIVTDSDVCTRDVYHYGFEVSAEMVSKITDKILPEIEEWQNRPLDSVKNDGLVTKKAVYVVLAINTEGFKDVIGILD